jgi:hypothetical protein
MVIFCVGCRVLFLSGWGQREEMTQALYAHMNNKKIKIKKKELL